MRSARLLAVVTLIAASGTVSGSTAAVTGEQRVLVVLATTGAQPYGVAKVDEVAAATAAFYGTSSLGRLRLHIDVTPWVTAFQADPGCNFPNVSVLEQGMQPARLAAQKAGYDANAYDELVYVIAGSRCGFLGVTRGHEVVLTREPDLELLAHELGHTFGLGHARAARCTNGFSCILYDPGDPFTPMGTGDELIDFSTYEKVVLGWLPPQPHVTAAGQRSLSAVDHAHALIVDTAQGQYWLEYHSQPFRGILVRFVDTHQPPSIYAPSSTLIIDPAGPAHDWIGRGQTFRAVNFQREPIFKVRLADAGLKRGQIQFAWTDRAAPFAPYAVFVDPTGTQVDWTAAIDEGSGVAYYLVRVDLHQAVHVDATETDLPILSPGRHLVSVIAVDRAGNRSRPSQLSFVVS